MIKEENDVNTVEIIDAITALKNKKQKIYTNCFMQFQHLEKENWEAVSSDQSLYLIDQDHGVNRVLFYTVDFEDLNGLLREFLDNNKEYVLEVLSKEASLYQDFLEQAGFRQYKRVMRMSNRDISSLLESDSLLLQYYNPTVGEKAKEKDVKQINQKLWDIFDTRVSHLLTDEEVKESVERGEIYLVKDSTGNIQALLQRVAEPKSFYINQIYNGGDKGLIHAVLLNELRKYYDQGGRYLYAWVEEDNMASRKFHEKFGLTHDGLWDVIYLR